MNVRLRNNKTLACFTYICFQNYFLDGNEVFGNTFDGEFSFESAGT